MCVVGIPSSLNTAEPSVLRLLYNEYEYEQYMYISNPKNYFETHLVCKTVQLLRRRDVM